MNVPSSVPVGSAAAGRSDISFAVYERLAQVLSLEAADFNKLNAVFKV